MLKGSELSKLISNCTVVNTNGRAIDVKKVQKVTILSSIFMRSKQ